jgi:hypothetical protein
MKFDEYLTEMSLDKLLLDTLGNLNKNKSEEIILNKLLLKIYNYLERLNMTYVTLDAAFEQIHNATKSSTNYYNKNKEEIDNIIKIISPIFKKKYLDKK